MTGEKCKQPTTEAWKISYQRASLTKMQVTGKLSYNGKFLDNFSNS